MTQSRNYRIPQENDNTQDAPEATLWILEKA